VKTSERKKTMKPRSGMRVKSDSGFEMVSYIALILFTLFAAIPFWLVIANSFATEQSIAVNGFVFWPSEISLEAYDFVFAGKQIYYSYRNTLFLLIIGVPSAMTVTCMFAYVLAHPKARFRRSLSFFTYFTMLMGTSLVGFYILIATWLGIKDTYWALTLPRLLHPFYAFILVAAFRDIPYEIYEASSIDGSGELRTFLRIMLPIALPSVATIGLFFTLLFWNDWWLALLFIDDYKLYPLQMMLRSLISEVSAAAFMGGEVSSGILPSNSMKMAVVCLTIGPILIVYPYIQRYFVKGIAVGAVKG
jgi:putative aldouronate transport system permease protein